MNGWESGQFRPCWAQDEHAGPTPICARTLPSDLSTQPRKAKARFS